MFAELLRSRSWRIPVILSAVRVIQEEGFTGPGPAASLAADKIRRCGERKYRAQRGRGSQCPMGEAKCFRAIHAVVESRCRASGPGIGRWYLSFSSIFLPPLTRLVRIDGSSAALVFRAMHSFCPLKSLAHQRFRLNFHIAEPPQVRFKVLQSPEFTIPSLSPPSHCTSSSSPPCGRPALP
jgi:hypothetical protein